MDLLVNNIEQDEYEIFKRNLYGSKILQCEINGKNINKNAYKALLLYLYFNTDKEIILKNTILNISQEEICDKGFTYIKPLGLSIRFVNSYKILKEIINIVKITNKTMELKLCLKNNQSYQVKVHANPQLR